jgi:hypothetical protein
VNKQPYIYNKTADILFICLPPFVCVLSIMLFPNLFLKGSVSDWWWLLLVVGIDVTHVYTTLYKTYAHPDNFSKHKVAFSLIPILCFLVAFLLYAFGSIVFWMVIAYIAVFHFVRQQYGFVRIYSRQDTNKTAKLIDSVMIYAATIYPVIYWHCHGPFEFNWFVKNDFAYLHSKLTADIAYYIYLLICITWLIKEVVFFCKQQTLNIPKVLMIVGTALSWYIGIVQYNSDLTFSILNIVSHGIPYIALVWFDQKKEQEKTKELNFLQRNQLFSIKKIGIFLLIPLVLAFGEEYLWNIFVWQEDRIYFAPSNFTVAKEWKQILVPLLILPQLTHYVIDGFIWKVSKGHVSL